MIYLLLIMAKLPVMPLPKLPPITYSISVTARVSYQDVNGKIYTSYSNKSIVKVTPKWIFLPLSIK